MPFLRVLLAGLIAIAAMAAVMLTAIMVLLTGLAGFVAQLFRAKTAAPRPGENLPPVTDRTHVGRPSGDVIDVVATDVPQDAKEN